MKRTPTAKALRFAQEYIVDLNATQAAIRAGYARSSANVHGHRLLARADVQAEVARLQQERAQRVSISADDVLREVAGIAAADVPAPKTVADKLKALDMLMRHLGLFTKDNETRGKAGMTALADAILGKVAGAGGLALPDDGGQGG